MATLLTIRLPKAEWAKAWRAMIEVAPVRLVGDDPVYEVLPVQLELLTARGFTYEIVPVKPRRPEKRRHERGKARVVRLGAGAGFGDGLPHPP